MHFSVRDQGARIAAEVLPRIFDRYWQLKANGRVGLGLGLYIVTGIVEAHGGHIGVDSALGRGSTFSFSIPDEPKKSRAESSQTGTHLMTVGARADLGLEDTGGSS